MSAGLLAPPKIEPPDPCAADSAGLLAPPKIEEEEVPAAVLPAAAALVFPPKIELPEEFPEEDPNILLPPAALPVALLPAAEGPPVFAASFGLLPKILLLLPNMSLVSLLPAGF